MAFSKRLLNIEYLIFSSHKTGTQTLRNTLNSNGLSAIHCHRPIHIGIESGDFEAYVEKYNRCNSQKLNIISVFREPIERHISSFFQGYGTKPLNRKEVESELETIIYQYSIQELQALFISELRHNRLIGLPESIEEICRELALDVKTFTYSNTKRFGLYETDTIRLFLFRFDRLFDNPNEVLSYALHKKITTKSANQSESKWYRDIYKEFKQTLLLPKDMIVDIYEKKRDLIDLFYPNKYDYLLEKTLAKYSD